MYQVKLEQFSGPLEKLLELIEEKELEITTISLAGVTADFLEYLKSLSEEAKHPSVLADFVVVAATLLLIKSKSILPSLELTQEEEGNIKDLETRLRIYKEYKVASTRVDALWKTKQQSFSRLFLMNLPSVFYPPEGLKVKNLEETIRSVLSQLQSLIPEKQTVKRIVVSVEAKVKELMERLTKQAEHGFQSLAQNKSKLEIIVLFLAILHLLRDSLIKAEQKGQFSDIIIKK